MSECIVKRLIVYLLLYESVIKAVETIAWVVSIHHIYFILFTLTKHLMLINGNGLCRRKINNQKNTFFLSWKDINFCLRKKSFFFLLKNLINNNFFRAVWCLCLVGRFVFIFIYEMTLEWLDFFSLNFLCLLLLHVFHFFVSIHNDYIYIFSFRVNRTYNIMNTLWSLSD